MLGYITLGTNDLAAASRFYDTLFKEINVGRTMAGSEQHGYVVWAKDKQSTAFGVVIISVRKCRLLLFTGPF